MAGKRECARTPLQRERDFFNVNKSQLATAKTYPIGVSSEVSLLQQESRFLGLAMPELKREPHCTTDEATLHAPELALRLPPIWSPILMRRLTDSPVSESLFQRLSSSGGGGQSRPQTWHESRSSNQDEKLISLPD